MNITAAQSQADDACYLAGRMETLSRTPMFTDEGALFMDVGVVDAD